MAWGGCDEHEGGKGGGAMPSPLQHPAGRMLASRSSSSRVTPMPNTNSSRRRPVAALIKTRTADAAAPTSSILLPSSLHEHNRSHSSTVQAHAMAPRSRASTRHDPVLTVGHTTYSSVRSWGRWTRPAPMAAAPASPIRLYARLHEHKTTHTGSAKACHGPTFPCKRTPRPRAHSRAHNVPKCLQLGQVGQACTNGRRP